MGYSSYLVQDEEAKVNTLIYGLAYQAFHSDVEKIYRLSGMKAYLPEVQTKAINHFFHSIWKCKSVIKVFFLSAPNKDVFLFSLLQQNKRSEIRCLEDLLHIVRQFYYYDCIPKMLRHFCCSFRPEFLNKIYESPLFEQFMQGIGLPEGHKKAMKELMDHFDQSIRELEKFLVRLYGIVEEIFAENAAFLEKKKLEVQEYIEKQGISNVISRIYPQDYARGRAIPVSAIVFMPSLFFPFSFQYNRMEGRVLVRVGVHHSAYCQKMQATFPDKRVVQVALNPFATVICASVTGQERSLEEICRLTALPQAVVEYYLHSLVYWTCVLRMKRDNVQYYRINYMFHRRMVQLLPLVREKRDLLEKRNQKGGKAYEKVASSKRRDAKQRGIG